MIYAILYVYVFWILFLAIMGLRAQWKSLALIVKVTSAPAYLLGVVMDIAFNLTAATLIFLDFPKEVTLTQRLERYMRGGGWRAPVARFICRNFLDPFQANGHCKQ